MLQLFIISSEADYVCVKNMQYDLKNRGYVTWVDANGVDSNSIDSIWQQSIRESRVVIVLWSRTAAQTDHVTRQLDYAQWLHKRILVVALDATVVPATLTSVPRVSSTSPCTDVVAQLSGHLPFTDAIDLLDSLLTDSLIGQTLPPSATPASDETSHRFGVRCRCPRHYTTYFDRREVCRHSTHITRHTTNHQERDTLRLPCGAPECPEHVVVNVDCAGYK